MGVPAVTRRSVRFSRDRRHRYLLTREFGAEQGDLFAGFEPPVSGAALWIMLNPSVADGRKDDPTIRRCLSFTASWNMRRLEVCNLFGLVATAPADLKRAEDPVGVRNDALLRARARSAARVICAWGAQGAFRGRADAVCAMLRKAGHPLYVLGLTADGQPKHPLYVRGNTPLVPWEPPL